MPSLNAQGLNAQGLNAQGLNAQGLNARGYAVLREMQCVPRSVSISCAATPWQVLAALGDASDVVFLVGEWADSSVLIATDPIFRAGTDADPADVFATQPMVSQPVSSVVGGGWFGLLGYERAANHLAFYDHLLRWDDRDGWRLEMLWSDERAEELARAEHSWTTLLDSLGAVSENFVPSEPEHAWKISTFLPMSTRDLHVARNEHLAAVEQAVWRIRRGDIYQVNVCTRFGATFDGDAAQMFAHAAPKLGSARGAYLRHCATSGARHEIASFSPELFLRRRADRVETRPIKGTRSRSDDSELGAFALARSAKDVAENVMIVDLMRNDLARVCVPGSVQTPDLLRVEPHAGVWHLISTVTGQLREGCDDGDLIASCFPPGSVTGAPKIKATEVIAEIEPLNRGAYTGAIGFASPTWGLELSVVIRTLEIADGIAAIGVGGGVTTDSVPLLEWQECLDKLAPVVAACGGSMTSNNVENTAESGLALPERPVADSLLETMLAVDGNVLRLADHLGRLGRSVAELWGCVLPVDLADRLNAVASAEKGRRVVRMIASRPTGGGTTAVIEVRSDTAPATSLTTGARIVRRSRRNWRHKWADRSELAAIEKTVTDAHPGDSPLFLDQFGALAEFSRGSIFLCAGRELVTPPLTDDVLPGVTRQGILDVASDLGLSLKIAPIVADDLRVPGVKAFWSSAISGIVSVESLDGEPLERSPDAEAVEWELRRRLGFT